MALSALTNALSGSPATALATAAALVVAAAVLLLRRRQLRRHPTIASSTAPLHERFADFVRSCSNMPPAPAADSLPRFPAVPQLELPRDEEGYVQSFTAATPAELEAVRAFFRTYGFVVLRDVVDPALVHTLQSEVMGKLGLEPSHIAAPPPAKQLEAIPWRPRVYQSDYNESKGFLNDCSFSQAAFDVRSSPRLHAAYAALYGTPRLWCKFDRFGLMRPVTDHPEWATDQGFVHWDANPWAEPNFARMQGILLLSDHRENSGGFHCIPGFHKVYQEYAAHYAALKKSGVLIDLPCAADKAFVQKITAPAGCFIIWDSRLPHGNYPNSSGAFRLVHYLTLHPAPADDSEAAASRKAQVQRALAKYHPDIRFSALGEKIHGLSAYTEADVAADSFAGTSAHGPLPDLTSLYNSAQWGV